MSARRGGWKAGALRLAVQGALWAPGGCWLACSAADPPPACEGGYRRAGLLRDFALDRGWTIYADCAHPERPMVAVAAEAAPPMAPEGPAAGGAREGRGAASPGAGASAIAKPGAPGGSGIARAGPAAAGRPVIESGARVRAWRRDGVAAIDLAGIAIESGPAGARIRVRILAGGAVLRGTVRAAGSVELEPPGAGFSGEGR